ncbi:MAG: transposase [Thermodesulfobacteriota bacterium]
MARPLRLEFPGALYHITSRGNAREEIFFDDDDRTNFLNLLGREVEQQRWICHTYCLMTNHYHLMIETPERNPVTGMRRLNGVYTQWFNRRHGRVGHLFQGRYKNIIVDREIYLLELCRCVVLNPVRARMVKQPGDWRWSSYLATAGQTDKPDWLETDWILGQFSHVKKRAQEAYKRFIADGVGSPSPWMGLQDQIWLGTKTFLEKMEGLIRRGNLKEVPLVQRSPGRPTKLGILESVAESYGITVQELVNRSDQDAYKTAVYLSRRAVNQSLKAVANEFGVSPSRVSRIQGDIDRGVIKN